MTEYDEMNGRMIEKSKELKRETGKEKRKWKGKDDKSRREGRDF